MEDLDGDGANPPIVSTDTLAANTSYDGMIELLNESTSPAEDVTSEVQAEGEDHQFFFSTTLMYR